jgi:molybdate transport system substrate-binding protein
VPAICVKRGNPKGIHTLEDLARDDVRVGMGNPETVCVGLYAHEILCRAGLWDEVKIRIENRYASSCSSTESLLVLDQADAIMGWDVFEHWDPDAIEAILIDPEYLPRAAYIPGAVSTYAADLEKARDFLNFIVSKKAIYGAEGYMTTEQELRTLYPDIEIGGVYELPENWDA